MCPMRIWRGSCPSCSRGAAFQVERWATVGDLQSRADRIGVWIVLVAGGANMPGAHPLDGFVPQPIATI